MPLTQMQPEASASSKVHRLKVSYVQTFSEEAVKELYEGMYSYSSSYKCYSKIEENQRSLLTL